MSLEELGDPASEAVEVAGQDLLSRACQVLEDRLLEREPALGGGAGPAPLRRTKWRSLDLLTRFGYIRLTRWQMRDLQGRYHEPLDTPSWACSRASTSARGLPWRGCGPRPDPPGKSIAGPLSYSAPSYASHQRRDQPGHVAWERLELGIRVGGVLESRISAREKYPETWTKSSPTPARWFLRACGSQLFGLSEPSGVQSANQDACRRHDPVHEVGR